MSWIISKTYGYIFGQRAKDNPPAPASTIDFTTMMDFVKKVGTGYLNSTLFETFSIRSVKRLARGKDLLEYQMKQGSGDTVTYAIITPTRSPYSEEFLELLRSQMVSLGDMKMRRLNESVTEAFFFIDTQGAVSHSKTHNADEGQEDQQEIGEWLFKLDKDEIRMLQGPRLDYHQSIGMPATLDDIFYMKIETLKLEIDLLEKSLRKKHQEFSPTFVVWFADERSVTVCSRDDLWTTPLSLLHS